eukprot:gene8310-8495_t
MQLQPPARQAGAALDVPAEERRVPARSKAAKSRKQPAQQLRRQQGVQTQARVVPPVTAGDVAALEGCQDWQGLEQWLRQDINGLRHHHQQRQGKAAKQWQAPAGSPRQQDQLWQHLEPAFAFEAVKHAARLAGKLSQMQQRSAMALQAPAAEGMLDGWFLVATIGLAAHLQACQQRCHPLGAGANRTQVQLADDTWYGAWVAALLRMPMPFTSSQLSSITASAAQLGRQLPGILEVQQSADKAPSSCIPGAGVVDVQERHVQGGLQVLQALQELCQLKQQIAGLPVAQHWLATAAGLLPRSVTEAVSPLVAAAETSAGHGGHGAAGRAAAGGVARGALAQAQLQLVAAVLGCLVSLEWRGASQDWCQRVWESVLLAATAVTTCSPPSTAGLSAAGLSAAGATPLQEQQPDAKLAFVVSQDLVECLVQICHGLDTASSIACSDMPNEQRDMQMRKHKRQRKRWHQLSRVASSSAASIVAEARRGQQQRRQQRQQLHTHSLQAQLGRVIIQLQAVPSAPWLLQGLVQQDCLQQPQDSQEGQQSRAGQWSSLGLHQHTQLLRAVGVSLVLLGVRVPGSWLTAYVQATGRAMQAAAPGSAGAGGLPGGWGHQQAFAAFLGNAAYALARLGVVPSHAWQLLWRRHLQLCDCGMLAKSVWCLRRLRLKAPIAWLDALYDAALLQVNQASMPQLLQLLHGLQHQDFELAPARLDFMLQAAAEQLLASFAGAEGCNNSNLAPRQLMQLVELVVLLEHDPTPEWCSQVGRAAQNMLQRQSVPAATKGAGLSTWLLARLLDCWAQLDVPLSDAAQVAFRALVKRQLPYFGKQSLPRLLSAVATQQHRALLHKQFMQLLLVHMRRQLQSAHAEALGLVGVSVGQLGLLMSAVWTKSFMQRVKALAGTPVAVRDAGNLERAVQYLSWCKQRAAVCRRARGSSMRLRYRGKKGVRKHGRLLSPVPKRGRQCTS